MNMRHASTQIAAGDHVSKPHGDQADSGYPDKLGTHITAYRIYFGIFTSGFMHSSASHARVAVPLVMARTMQ